MTAPIIGPLRIEQLEDSLGVVGWQLAEEQARLLADVSAIEEFYPYCFILDVQRG